LIRQHLEANHLKDRYKITTLYCDWCLHPELDRSRALKDFFREIDDAISDGKEALLNDRINDAISLKQLRFELIEIVNPAGADSKLFSSHLGWMAFLGVLLNLLLEKPIIRTKIPTEKRLAGEFVLEKPDRSNLDKNYLAETTISQGAIFWKILVLPIGYMLTGPLALTENLDDFVYD
jgi:hypothetical protein